MNPVQVLLQPILSVLFPSSQDSKSIFIPSPHFGEQVVPIQSQPVSIEQNEEHPSLLITFPSSQPSYHAETPSPHTIGTQT